MFEVWAAPASRENIIIGIGFAFYFLGGLPAATGRLDTPNSTTSGRQKIILEDPRVRAPCSMQANRPTVWERGRYSVGTEGAPVGAGNLN
jgi:hypothetical protein